MDSKLWSISRALAKSSIDSYNRRATFDFLLGGLESITKCVYEELLIGAKYATHDEKLAKNIARVALIAYWKMLKASPDLANLEATTLFRHSVISTHATLKKMIKETNHLRRSN